MAHDNYKIKNSYDTLRNMHNKRVDDYIALDTKFRQLKKEHEDVKRSIRKMIKASTPAEFIEARNEYLGITNVKKKKIPRQTKKS